MEKQTQNERQNEVKMR